MTDGQECNFCPCEDFFWSCVWNNLAEKESIQIDGRVSYKKHQTRAEVFVRTENGFLRTSCFLFDKSKIFL
jgi:hypothetical protein